MSWKGMLLQNALKGESIFLHEAGGKSRIIPDVQMTSK